MSVDHRRARRLYALDLLQGLHCESGIPGVAGQDFTLEELLEIGERRLNMLRAFNARLGLDRSADALPEKFFQPLTGEGPTAGVALNHDELETAKDEYYRQAGWDVASGNPTEATLERLGLAWIE